MLRQLLGEPPRENEGLLADTMDSMFRFVHLLQKEIKQNSDSDEAYDYRKFEVWTYGLVSSLDELEQCLYAATFYRKLVQIDFVDDMTPTQKGDYARYVFFYKDGFIRVFSILDKLGTLLNEMYDLNTSKVKTHYSYFTVLRQFHYLRVHEELGNKLISIKEDYKEPLYVLRRRRNTETHYMNVEMQDDLWQRQRAIHGKIELEDLNKYIRELEQGYEMVCKSLHSVFEYTQYKWAKIN